MTENNKLQTIEQQLVQEKNVSDNVLNKVRVLESQGNLELPNDYSPSNAMKQAWMQSSMIKDEKALQNSKTHNNFKEEMAKKTVINRAAKRYINTSTDSNLFKYAQESEQRQRKEVLDAEVEENANQEQLDFEQPVLEEAQYTELENDKPIDVSDFEEIKEPATEKESEEEPF
ncbi:TPA: recombinase RecT [Staphylococcus aureus]|nr:recombinase RecT [Staphylococcus aureus]